MGALNNFQFNLVNQSYPTLKTHLMFTKTINYTLTAAFLISLFAISGCENQKEKKSDSDIKSELLKKLENKNKQLSDKIDDLLKEADNAGGDAKDQIEETVSKIKSEKKKIDRTIKKVRKSSEKEISKLEKE